MKHVPSSVYRFQLSKAFTLKQATQRLPYLKALGIEGVYCSPYFTAYSPHGYDITDPNQINPQVATAKEYDIFCKKLKALELFHIADIVPNHMGIKGENKWWLDVLEKGRASPYARFFDIDWKVEKIHIPILGDPYEKVLKTGQLKIVHKHKKIWIQYGDQLFPINPKTYSNKASIDRLLEKQHYRLVYWLDSAKETSYRRFFNINELIGVRMEDKAVYQAHHKLIFELLKTKKIDGLRVDHPDGLYDPKSYFDALRKKHKGLIVVEKILGWKEEIPHVWNVDGTVGYEFLNMLSGIFVKKSKTLTDVYARFIKRRLDFEHMVYEKKKFYMRSEMAGDVKRLNDLLEGDHLNALYELLAAFPIYRSYIRPVGPLSEQDKPYIAKAFKSAREKSSENFDMLENIFSLKAGHRDFIMRFQQLAAAVMAKGFEDISLYNYNRLLALNEVGSAPERGGITVQEFHDFCLRKREKWPLGFLASSTHDTKRSLDVRMQLAVLSEIPEKWEKALHTWTKINRKYKTKIKSELFPDSNAEYFLYQILLGAWPSRPSFKRMWESFQKSIREARAHTSWRHPDVGYEKACETFLQTILKKNSPFLKHFEPFQKKLVEYGAWNSLSATALKLGCPGIVDIYEGCENWRYNLVDPDNRRPVDQTQPESLKSHLHRVALNFRKKHKTLFLEGQYIPLEIKGKKKEHVIAYLRTYNKQSCLVAAVRFFTSIKDLKGTQIILPKKMGRGEALFSEATFEGKALLATEIFANAPFAWVFWA